MYSVSMPRSKNILIEQLLNEEKEKEMKKRMVVRERAVFQLNKACDVHEDLQETKEFESYRGPKKVVSPFSWNDFRTECKYLEQTIHFYRMQEPFIRKMETALFHVQKNIDKYGECTLKIKEIKDIKKELE